MNNQPVLQMLLIFTLLVSGCVDPANEEVGESGERIEGVFTNIVDGDTYDFRSESGTEYRIRILGVDTPEVYSDNDPEFWEDCGFDEEYLKEWGEKSTDFVKDNYDGAEVEIEKRGIDPYDRQRAKVFTQDNSSLSRILLNEGYANTFTARAFPEMNEYLELERNAREKRKGIWEGC